MKPLTEGNMLHAKKKRKEIKKKMIKHSDKLHTPEHLYMFMSGCMLLGLILIIVAKNLDIVTWVYIISIIISIFAIYHMDKLTCVNILHAKRMRYDHIMTLFVIFFGPITTLFLLITLLLPPKDIKKTFTKKNEKGVVVRKNLYTSIIISIALGGLLMLEAYWTHIAVGFHVCSAFVSILMINFLPNVAQIVNLKKSHLNTFTHNVLICLFIVIFGPIATTFILSTSLLPLEKGKGY